MSEEKNPLEYLVKHPVAPVVGGLLLAASYLTDEPAPPPIPDGMPEATASQWQMIYAQNQQRYERRMTLFKDVGMVLLGYASAQSVISSLPKRGLGALAATVDPARADLIRRERGAM